MNLLAFDGVTDWASVAVAVDGQLQVERTWRAGRNHAAELPVAIHDCLGAAGVRAGNIDTIVVSTGPGSYTGIRVGLAIAKGMSTGTGCRLIGISTLEQLAFACAAWDGPVCSVMPVGSDRLAFGLFRGTRDAWQRLSDDRSVTAESVTAELPVGTLLCGGGASRVAVSPDITHAPAHFDIPKASTLVSLVALSRDATRQTNIEPNYLRLSTPEERLLEIA